MRFLRLKKDMWFAKAGTIILDDGYSYEINGETYDTRSDVATGEVAILLDKILQNKLNSILEEIKEEV